MEKELFVKQLLYRSTHRGCKETDFLVGEFAKEALDKMSEEALKLFAEFIEENDWEIYDWLLEKVEGPEKYRALLQDIRAFHQIIM